MGFARTGSNPVAVVKFVRGCGKKFVLIVGAIDNEASLAQWLERSAVNRKVAGSIPAGGAFIAIQTFNSVLCGPLGYYMFVR